MKLSTYQRINACALVFVLAFVPCWVLAIAWLATRCAP